MRQQPSLGRKQLSTAPALYVCLCAFSIMMKCILKQIAQKSVSSHCFLHSELKLPNKIKLSQSKFKIQFSIKATLSRTVDSYSKPAKTWQIHNYQLLNVIMQRYNCSQNSAVWIKTNIFNLSTQRFSEHQRKAAKKPTT